MSSNSNITVNGAPLEAYVSEQIGGEIQKTHAAEIRGKKWRRPVITRSNSSSSIRPKTKDIVWEPRGATHVIVKGNLFEWAVKMPYVPSGKSVLGAIEYDQDSDQIKCHECGEWTRGLNTHITKHKMSTKDYKISHGLLLRTALLSVGLRERVRKSNAKTIGTARAAQTKKNSLETQKHMLAKRADIFRERRHLGATANSENLNLVGHCKAQRLDILRRFSEELGRTPTKQELCEFRDSSGRKPLLPQALRKLFGVSPTKVMVQAGLRLDGRRSCYV